MSSESITPKILIVDDVSDNIEVLRKVLRDDYVIVAALNGEKGLQLAQAEPHPDIILLDIIMPGLDGYEVCRRLKAEPSTADIPVIFITVVGEVKSETKGLELGAVDYIVRPISPSVVRARIKTHLTLNKQAKALTQLNKDKNRFLGMAAHDLRNPLMLISGYTELLLSKSLGELNTKQMHYLQVIEQSTRSLFNLIDDLLDVSKIESGQLALNLQETDIDALFQSTLSIFRLHAHRKNILIKYAIDETLPKKLLLDKDKVGQVLSNLVSNAIKYSHAGTRVDIHVFPENHNIVIEVRDQGQGIPQDEVAKIFHPFQKTRGVDLYVTYKSMTYKCWKWIS